MVFSEENLKWMRNFWLYVRRAETEEIKREAKLYLIRHLKDCPPELNMKKVRMLLDI